jgi:hypothetical protein
LSFGDCFFGVLNIDNCTFANFQFLYSVRLFKGLKQLGYISLWCKQSFNTLLVAVLLNWAWRLDLGPFLNLFCNVREALSKCFSRHKDHSIIFFFKSASVMNSPAADQICYETGRISLYLVFFWRVCRIKQIRGVLSKYGFDLKLI